MIPGPAYYIAIALIAFVMTLAILSSPSAFAWALATAGITAGAALVLTVALPWADRLWSRRP